MNATTEPARRTGPTNARVEIARYTITAGERIIYGQRILGVVRAMLKKFPMRDMCMMGGVALNCVANAKILEQTDVRRIWVPPCASDTGAPLGSALWHYHQTQGHARGFELKHAFYGQAYGDDRITQALDRWLATQRAQTQVQYRDRVFQ